MKLKMHLIIDILQTYFFDVKKIVLKHIIFSCLHYED